jgi:hypothetical protein
MRRPRRSCLPSKRADPASDGALAAGTIGRDPYHQPAAFPIADRRQSSQIVVAALKKTPCRFRAALYPRRRARTPYHPQPCWRVNASTFRLSPQWRMRVWRTAEPTGRPLEPIPGGHTSMSAGRATLLIFVWSDILSSMGMQGKHPTDRMLPHIPYKTSRALRTKARDYEQQTTRL